MEAIEKNNASNTHQEKAKKLRKLRRWQIAISLLGAAIVVWGIIIVRKPQKKTETIEINNEQTVKNEAKPTVNEKIQQDDFDENKAKGDAFEKFVVKNFDRKYFTLQEWRSDKYVDGIYAVSNHFPDLEVTFTFRKKNIPCNRHQQIRNKKGRKTTNSGRTCNSICLKESTF